MKFARTVLLVCSTAIAVPALAVAQDKGPENRRAPLTQEQWNAKVADKFKSADAKADGKLTLEEYRSYLKREEERRKSERQAAMFRAMDADNDGVVTEQEFKDAAFRKGKRGGHHKGKWGGMKPGESRKAPARATN